MDVCELVPRKSQAAMAWLGSVPGWLSYRRHESLVPDGIPRTEIHVDWPKLNAACKTAEHKEMVYTVRRTYTTGGAATLAALEACAKLMADGPKLFRPTEEQFEAMEQVELRLPPGDFHSPFPALVVAFPAGARARLTAVHGVAAAKAGSQILVRDHREPGGVPTVVVSIPLRDGMAQHFIFSDQPGNDTIETALNRAVKDNKAQAPGDMNPAEADEYAGYAVVARAALNLCLMLTHYGAKVAGPVDPAAYAKHRKRPDLAHLKFGDYLAVNMKQDITVRAPSPRTGDGTGPPRGEAEPRWVRGYWRAAPGFAARRWAGETVPLNFVRPDQVRADRIVGDVSQSEVTYHG